MSGQSHFLRRKVAILAACDAYASGTAAVGAEDRAAAAATAPPASAASATAEAVPAASASPSDGSSDAAGQAGQSAGPSASAAPPVQPPDAAAATQVDVAGRARAPMPSAEAGSSQGFRILLQQLKPRLEAAIDSLQE